MVLVNRIVSKVLLDEEVGFSPFKKFSNFQAIRSTFQRLVELLDSKTKEVREISLETAVVLLSHVKDDFGVIQNKFFPKLRSSHLKILQEKCNNLPRRADVISLLQSNDTSTRVMTSVTQQNFHTNRDFTASKIYSPAYFNSSRNQQKRRHRSPFDFA